MARNRCECALLPRPLIIRAIVQNIAGEIQVVLFDIGGVLVELGGVSTMQRWLGPGVTVEEMWRRWLCSDVVRRFESGRATPEEFSARIIHDMSLPVSPEEFLHAFTNWPQGLYPGTLDMLRGIPGSFTRATLSNTNALHWTRMMQDFELEQAFHHHFASHLTGLLKPDAEVFAHIARTLGCPPQAIFFLDDNILNVDAARNAGFRSVRVQGAAEARAALLEAGIIQASSHSAR